jgi:hypothetical protein
LDFQKGNVFHDEDYGRHGDDSFSDKSGGSKTTDGSSIATAVPENQNTQAVELVIGAALRAPRLISMVTRWWFAPDLTPARSLGTRRNESMVMLASLVFYVPVFSKGRNKNIGILEGTAVEER